MGLHLELAPLLVSLTRVLLGVLVLMAARIVKGMLSPYRMEQELTTNDNPAFGLTLAGYYLASVAVFVGAVHTQAVPLDQGSVAVIQAFGLDLGFAVGGI